MGLTSSQALLLEESKLSALEMGDQGRSLTNLIGVLSACDYLNLDWRPTEFQDAVSANGERVRIKARRTLGAGHKVLSGRMNKFGYRSGYDFDMGVIVALNQDCEIVAIWVRNSKSIEELESAGTVDRPIRIRRFTSGAFSPERFVDATPSIDEFVSIVVETPFPG